MAQARDNDRTRLRPEQAPHRSYYGSITKIDRNLRCRRFEVGSRVTAEICQRAKAMLDQMSTRSVFIPAFSNQSPKPAAEKTFFRNDRYQKVDTVISARFAAVFDQFVLVRSTAPASHAINAMAPITATGKRTAIP